MLGDPNSDDEYATPGTRDNKPNYQMGRRQCAALTVKLEGTAARWWREYDRKDKNSPPNCWKPSRKGALPDGPVVEVSLNMLLKNQFNGAVDARISEIELEKIPLGGFWEDALLVIAFRTTIDELLRRAQKTSQFDRIRCISNTLPRSDRNI